MIYIAALITLVIGLMIGHSQARKHSEILIRVIRGAHFKEIHKTHTESYNQGWKDCEKVGLKRKIPAPQKHSGQ